MILCMIMVAALYGSCAAFDLPSLDRVAVSMPRSTVLLLLGKPDEVGELKDGLEVDIYKSNDLSPMMGTGCIYGDDKCLAGQSFIFQGEMARQAVERLQQDGFTLTEEKGETFRMLGKDDDTGQPLVVQIIQGAGLTVVMTFEKGFYDRRAK
ncbi:MAG: hypothetical protein HY881_22170 [Deltaproteobacteria bacterium]|nr:hypothetical protein [Deltaproteobacteria bacterium]